MPAGSPRSQDEPGRRHSHPVFHERLVAQPAQPQLGFFFGLGFAQLGEGALAPHVFGGVVLAAAQQLDDVPAVLRLEGLR